MVGIGPLELLVLAAAAFFVFAVPIGVVVLVVALVRNQDSGRLAELEAENRQLRARLEGRPSSS
jgi:hypothetical protein